MSRQCGSFTLLVVLLLAMSARPGAAQTMPPLYDPANGHWYQAVRVAGAITWGNARAAAASLSYAGYSGHLVTITSADENQFIASHILGTAPDIGQWWLGGYQDTSAPDYVEPAGGWRWITGEPWSYTDWYPGEPNNYGGNEDALNFNHATEWNDFPRGSGLGGYIVEFEPVPIATGPLLSVQPNPIVGGQIGSGQVILAQPAGPGGVVLTLSSSNPAAAVVPASITVPTDANTLAFPVTTFAVASPTPVTISARSPAGSATVTIQVVPNPAPPPASPAPVYDPDNGHWYQAVLVPGGITWPAARAAAAALAYAGYPGHLVTITSAAENQFLVAHLPLSLDDHWRVGGYQDHSAPDYSEPAGGWRWITGEPWSYTNWRGGEPNNANGGEDFLEIHSDGTWNDIADWYAGANMGGYGYIVEFEPPAAPPPPPPAGAAQLALFPNPVPGGLLALGQVVLAQPAGPGGVTVSLASSSPTVALVPAAVVALPGANTVTFPIVTFPVAAPAAIRISASSAFGAAAATLQVLPLSAPPPPAPSTANLLVNGSFEEPPGGDRFGVSGGVPGWRIVTGDIDIVTNSYWQAAPDGGNQSIDLDGFHVGTIEQSFVTVPGQDYLFAGYLSHNPSVPYGRANVFLNGVFFTQLAHAIPDRNPDMQWQPFGYRFRATAAVTTLTISDVTGINSSQGTVLDGLSVTLAPDQNPPVAAGGAPAAPTGLMVRATSPSQVTLAWTDNSPGETAVAVWRKGGGADWARIAALPPHTTSFTDTGLAPGTSYTYRVRVINSTVASEWSNEVTVTTPAGV